jgi:hypothetical protein
MSIGGGGSSGSSQTQLDPQIKSDWQNEVFNRAQGTAGLPTPQQQTASFTKDQLLGQSLAAGTAGMGESAINSAVSGAERLAGSNYAPTINSQRTVGIGGSGNPLQFVQAPQQGSLAQYENPYTSDVVDTTMKRLDLQRRQALNQNSSDATTQGGEGAWDGSRAGVSDALTNDLALNTEAGALANLNQSNFGQAQQAAQEYAQMGLDASKQNQNTAFGAAFGNQSLQQQGELAQAGFLNDTANRQLAASQLLGSLAPTQQGVYSNAAGALMNVGGLQQQQQQNALNATYNNQLYQRNAPLQTMESAFGILPTTGSGSVTHSNSKSGNAGVGL